MNQLFRRLKWTRRGGYFLSLVSCAAVIIYICGQPLLIDERRMVTLRDMTSQQNALTLVASENATRLASPFSEKRKWESSLSVVAKNLNIDPNILIEACEPLVPINLCINYARINEGKRKLSKCLTDKCKMLISRDVDSNELVANQLNLHQVEDSVRRREGLISIRSLKTGFAMKENGVLFVSEPMTNRHDKNSATDDVQISTLSTNETSTPYSSQEPVGLDPYVYFDERLFFFGTPPEPEVLETDEKLITWFSAPRYSPKMPEPVKLRSCPKFPCLITTNQKYTSQSSAVIFNTANFLPKFPPKRSHREQVFIFHNQEPPIHTDNLNWNGFRLPEWRSTFNWTMTFRHDSDIVSPYGIIRRSRGSRAGSRTEPVGDPLKNYEDIMERKTKTVAAMISNCNSTSGRDVYIKELSRHIDVDIYGKCGTYLCPRGTDAKCLEMAGSEYMFWLSFESSMCEDYITEKFFRFMTVDLIPVVRGSNQYSAHAPREIFINAADFQSPRELAKMLKYLNRNRKEYIKMLKAKDEYTAIFEDWPILDDDGNPKFHHYHYEAVPLCQVCQRLWNLEKYRKQIPDIKAWFDEKQCKDFKDNIMDVKKAI